MARKIGKKIGKKAKPVKKSKLKPVPTSPVQPGTIEIVRETPFGPKYAVIRSNSEAGKGLNTSPPLLHMLAQITRDIPAPKESFLIQADRLVESLVRNQEIQRRMLTKAQEAADGLWPGFREMLGLMIERELEFTKALGEIGVGVA